VASNTFSLALIGLFRIEAVRRLLNIPPLIKPDKSLNTNAVREIWKTRKGNCIFALIIYSDFSDKGGTSDSCIIAQK
jgi:hypothetical protein